MRILMVCQRYYPEVLQNRDICEQLVEDGHEVTILTGLPNYDDGFVRADYRHGQRRKEVINGVKVIRTFEIGRRTGPIWRVFNYLSYMISASFYALSKLKNDYDIIIAYQLSPVLMAVPGIVVKYKYKIPLYLYCCDLWPESMKMMVKENSLPFKIMLKASRMIYSKMDKISVQSKSFIEYFEEIDNVNERKLCYIPQFASSEYLNENFDSNNGVVDFVFLGNIGIAQDIEMIINAIEMIKNVKGFMMHFVGDGSFLATAKKLVEEKQLGTIVRFYGRRSVDEMPHFYRLADVCIATLKANSIISQTIPSKVQGYMAAGKPILAALNGYGAEVIQESNCGICVPAGETYRFAQAMRQFIVDFHMYEKCGINAREYFKKYFTKRVVVDLIEKELEDLIKSNGGNK